ncbi:hypothetical protein sos41_28450 [Alphaproteobacteria bacterium SO-S41]|nr:hypothetical protein sos41_28450 [Alphaproteobacteria bacterium SO-S41]
MRTILGAALAASLALTTVHAEDKAPNPPLFSEQVGAFDPAAPLPEDKGGLLAQALALYGREDLRDRLMAAKKIAPCTVDAAHPDAVQAIVDGANASGLLIINEAHYEPRGRALIGRVLERLHADGFTVYAAETFAADVRGPDFAARPWPAFDDGGYSNDPVFGRTMRSAKALGYRFVDYEYDAEDPRMQDPNVDVGVREDIQAENLMARIFAAEPNAKAVIHVGHGHAAEVAFRTGDGTETRMMALRLKDKLGRDPFTVNTTYYTSPSSEPAVCTFVPSGPDDSPRMDLFIGLPAPAYEDGRPVWRRHDLGDHAIAVPAAFAGQSEKLAIEARPAGEPPLAVPLDRVLVYPGETLPLLLPPGTYTVRAYSWSKGWLPDEVPLTVPD